MKLEFPKGKSSLEKWNFANPNTLSPHFPNSRFTFSNFVFHYWSISTFLS